MSNQYEAFLRQSVPSQYRNEVKRKVKAEDFGESPSGDEYWVDFTENGEPGSLESYPCLVWCRRANQPGAVTNRNYQPLTGRR